MKKLIGLAMAVLLTASSAFAAGGNTGQTTTQVGPFPRVAKITITSPKDGAVFYGEYRQPLQGSAVYANKDWVLPGRLRWVETVGGRTRVIGVGSAVWATFTRGEHKLTLQVLNESNDVVASKSITVTFYESIR